MSRAGDGLKESRHDKLLKRQLEDHRKLFVGLPTDKAFELMEDRYEVRDKLLSIVVDFEKIIQSTFVSKEEIILLKDAIVDIGVVIDNFEDHNCDIPAIKIIKSSLKRK